MMRKKLLKGAITGGVIVFLWCLITWMVIPWQSRVFNKFNDECAVAEVIKNNACTSGIYILPNTYGYDSSTPSSEMEKAMAMMQHGPTLFASVNVEGIGQKSTKPFLMSLLFQILGAGIVTWLLLQTKGLNYKEKVGFVTLYGVAIWVLGTLPAWNWWAFPVSYVLLLLFNIVVGWFLAGLAIAKICK